MKRLLSWTLCMLMTLSISSQTLKPVIRLDSKDTFFCFNLEQSRRIAKELVNGRYCDSISHATEVKLVQMEMLTNLKDTTILVLKQKITGQDFALRKSDELIHEQDLSIRGLSRQLKSTKVQRVILIICSSLLATGLAIK